MVAGQNADGNRQAARASCTKLRGGAGGPVVVEEVAGDEQQVVSSCRANSVTRREGGAQLLPVGRTLLAEESEGRVQLQIAGVQQSQHGGRT